MKSGDLFLAAGLAALGYWLFRQYTAGNAFTAVTSSANRCPAGYALTIDNLGNATCVITPPGSIVLKAADSANKVYDMNGNLVDLNSIFNSPAYAPFPGGLTGQ